MIFPPSVSDIGVMSCAWKESWLHPVDREGQHLVCGGEGVLHPVPVMHVQVEVQDPLEPALEPVDGEHNVVHVAESRGSVALRVVPTPTPVDGNLNRNHVLIITRVATSFADPDPEDQGFSSTRIRKKKPILKEKHRPKSYQNYLRRFFLL